MKSTDADKTINGAWWGEFAFEEEGVRLWRLGPMSLWVERTPAEYRIATRSDAADEGSATLVGVPWTDAVPDDADLVRYGVGPGDRLLEILPAVADRSIIVKSDNEFVVPPGGTNTAFISSPVWMTLKLLSPSRLLREEPTWRPSDTWFGPSTTTGELGYAIRTSVRYYLERVPVRPYRAVSVVRINNLADTPLPLSRIRLPMPVLSLFAATDGRLWTEALTLERKGDDDLAEIKLGDMAPREAGSCIKIAGPRETMEPRHLFRSFAGLFGLQRGRGGYERVVE